MGLGDRRHISSHQAGVGVSNEFRPLTCQLAAALVMQPFTPLQLLRGGQTATQPGSMLPGTQACMCNTIVLR